MTGKGFRRLIMVVAAGLAVVVLADSAVLPRLPSPLGMRAARMVTVVAPAPPPSPFTDTPAESFPIGAAGIVLPPARSIPDGYLAGHQPTIRDITVEEVTEALGWVRAALIAARLDDAMLIEHDLEPFIRTLAPVYWEEWSIPWSRPWPSWRWWYELPGLANHATLLDAGVVLVEPPRVTGQIVYRTGTDEWGMTPRRRDPIWVLEILTQFVWVYAFEVPAGELGDGIVVVREEVSWVVPTDYRARFDWLDTDPNDGIHRRSAEARVWGADCQLYREEGWLRPGKPGRIPDAVFDVEQPLDADAGCRPGQ